MLKNRIKNVKYEELTPTIIIRKSRSKTNVTRIVHNRLLTIAKRKQNQPEIKLFRETCGNLGYGFNKAGYALTRNGVPLNSNGRNALAYKVK